MKHNTYDSLRKTYRYDYFCVAYHCFLLLFVSIVLISGVLGYEESILLIVFIASSLFSFYYSIDNFKDSRLKWRWIKQVKKANDIIIKNHETLLSFFIEFKYESDDLRKDITDIMNSSTEEEFMMRSKRIMEKIESNVYEDETTILYHVLYNIDCVMQYYNKDILKSTFLK